MLFLKYSTKTKTIVFAAVILFALFAVNGGFELFAPKAPTTPLAQKEKDNSVKVEMPRPSPQNIFMAVVLGNDLAYPVLKVAIPSKARLAKLLSPFGDGIDHDLLTRFANDYGFTLQFTEVNDYAQASAMMDRGEIDITAGFPGNYELAVGEGILASPPYQKVTPMLVRVKDKNKKPAFVFSDPSLVTEATSASLPEDTEFSSDDITELVDYLDAGKSGYALLDNASFSLLKPLFPRLSLASKKLAGSAYHHWAWRNNNSLAAISLASFWSDAATYAAIDELNEKYTGFLPRQPDSAKLAQLIKGLERELSTYHAAIAKASRENNLDPLLLTAVMFQESQFKDVSGENGLGLMQLTKATAEALGVDPSDPDANIKGGAKYLRKMFNSIKDKRLSYWDKWFLALAAYNQGPAHMEDAIELAKNKHPSGNISWKDTKEAYLLLETAPYASRAKRGSVRGEHVVKYVQSIRYYYYVLNGLVVLDRPEAEHLTPLIASRNLP